MRANFKICVEDSGFSFILLVEFFYFSELCRFILCYIPNSNNNNNRKKSPPLHNKTTNSGIFVILLNKVFF